MIRSASTLRSMALEHPETIRVFERFHLDYCCGGNRPLAEACAQSSISTEEVLAALSEAGNGSPTNEDFTRSTAAELIRHIVEKHHAYVRSELPRLQQMAERVAAKHGVAHPEVREIESELGQLAEELAHHLQKEEMILFPYVIALERQCNGGAPAAEACFGSVESPIRVMVNEHEVAGALLADMRSRSLNFTPPAGACPTFVGFYHGLDAFEHDLHQHVHLENNLLFPRAIAMEAEVLATR
jgi:regulator of cell morphogenesis and NO signaling